MIDFHHHHYFHRDIYDKETQALFRVLSDKMKRLSRALNSAFLKEAPKPPKENTDHMAGITGEDLLNQFAIVQKAASDAIGRGVATIDDLKAQIAAGSPVTQDQLAQLSASFQSTADSLNSFDITTPEPPAPIVPPTA